MPGASQRTHTLIINSISKRTKSPGNNAGQDLVAAKSSYEEGRRRGGRCGGYGARRGRHRNRNVEAAAVGFPPAIKTRALTPSNISDGQGGSSAPVRVIGKSDRCC